MKKPARTPPHRPDRVRIAKDLKAEIKAMRRAGWTLTTGGRHAMITCPAGTHSHPIPEHSSSVLVAFRVSIRRHDETCR